MVGQGVPVHKNPWAPIIFTCCRRTQLVLELFFSKGSVNLELQLNPFLSIKKSGLDILLTGYNNLTLQTY
jgi:hypothetical protein